MPDIRDKAVQTALADAYIANGGNSEQAAIAAGYSPRYARGNAYKLVACRGVQAMIQERNRDMANERIAEMEEINAFWTKVLRDEEADIKDRLKASELRARAAGAFVDRVHMTGAVPVVICGDDSIEE